MPTKKPFRKNQKVEAFTFGEWLPGRVQEVYDHGCDVIYTGGKSLSYYVIFENIREVS